MKEAFSGVYRVEDGYVGGDRPQHFTVRASELEEDMDDNALREYYEQSAQEHFEQHIAFSTDREAEFLEWAHAVLKRNVA